VELETDLSLPFGAAEWSSHSFIIKNFFTEADEDMVRFFYLIVVISNKAFENSEKKLRL
jgi:hypothetical protein